MTDLSVFLLGMANGVFIGAITVWCALPKRHRPWSRR